jgi:amidase
MSALRPKILVCLLIACFVAITAAQQRPTGAKPVPLKPFTVVEASIADIHTAMEQGRATSRDIVQQYLSRIAMYEDRLNAAIAVNPRALQIADERDRERLRRQIRGPLHGIPIALKDNIHTTDMPTTGGALAFDGLVPPYEATLTRNLRDAGAIIIAKTTLTELADSVASGMPGIYSALAGYSMNPYDPRRDPRDATFDGRPAMAPGGSSSGVGTSANFWTANVGTETSTSIISPSNQNMLVGIKPTVGRISRHGVIPATADQDTPGPMAKTVADAAILLGVLEGAQPDPLDPAAGRCPRPVRGDYTAYLNADGLKGARIGIPRAGFYDGIMLPGAKEPRRGLREPQARLMAEAIDVLKAHGAVIVDPADIPSVITNDANENFLLWQPCASLEAAKNKDAHCSVVAKYGMKRDFSEWLKSLGNAAPVKTLTGLRRWNIAHQKAGAIRYGQNKLDFSDGMDVELDRVRYRTDRDKDIRLAGTRGIDATMKEHNLDALLFAGGSGAALAAAPGYPIVIVPFGFVPNSPTPPFPDGFNAKPQPFGVAFTGRACSEPRLIELVYAFEQATKRRIPPPSVQKESLTHHKRRAL